MSLAWKAFHSFISSKADSLQDDCAESTPLSPGLILEFCIWLREVKDFQTSTICNYKASVSSILKEVFNVHCPLQEFKALKNSLFLEKPTNRPRIPSWDLEKVLDLLSSDKYSSLPLDEFKQLKKTLFLVAIATGNRISEINNMTRSGLKDLDVSQPASHYLTWILV